MTWRWAWWRAVSAERRKLRAACSSSPAAIASSTTPCPATPPACERERDREIGGGHSVSERVCVGQGHVLLLSRSPRLQHHSLRSETVGV
eukprot:1025320-Rhodomonas_salina.1